MRQGCGGDLSVLCNRIYYLSGSSINASKVRQRLYIELYKHHVNEFQRKLLQSSKRVGRGAGVPSINERTKVFNIIQNMVYRSRKDMSRFAHFANGFHTHSSKLEHRQQLLYYTCKEQCTIGTNRLHQTST